MSGQETVRSITVEKVQEALDFVYDKAISGVVGVDSAIDIAESYMSSGSDLHAQSNSLIRWQVAKAASSGFLTNLGGLLTLPITVPANMFTVVYVQVRMIAAIAHMGGHDVKDDRVRALVYSCLVATSTLDLAKDVGIAVGQKFATSAIRQISGETIKRINQRAGFRLLTKFGEKGAINLGKAVPFLGGLIGGTIDGVTTNLIGNIARDTFIGTAREASS